MAEEEVNSHKDISQTTTKITEKYVRLQCMHVEMNWSMWFVLLFHLSTTKQMGRRKRPIGGDFVSKAILLQFDFCFSKSQGRQKIDSRFFSLEWAVA